MTVADRWKIRPATTRYWAFKDQLVALYPHKLEARLIVDFYLPMPKSWSKKKSLDMLGKPHQQRPDIDNLSKSLMDCLAVEDQYIYDLHARKFWAQTGAIDIKQEVQ